MNVRHRAWLVLWLLLALKIRLVLSEASGSGRRLLNDTAAGSGPATAAAAAGAAPDQSAPADGQQGGGQAPTDGGAAATSGAAAQQAAGSLAGTPPHSSANYSSSEGALEAVPPGQESNPVDEASGAAVKVFAEMTEPDFSQPWQFQPSVSTTSSGVMVQGPHGEKWVLTNAHSVEYATQVQLKRRWDSRRYTADIVAVGRDCDVALLSVADPAFWQGAVFATFGGLPFPRDQVSVVGFPIGGDTISVTAGIVSRLEVVPYTFSQRELLALQIDAAINPGNSGGPVFNDQGQCVGVAFQAIDSAQAESVGYVVPVPIIFHFLDDVLHNGTFTGFPTLGLQLQRMESDTMRQAYQVPEGQGGVLVRRVYPVGSSAGQVLKDDVLQRFDGVDVAPDGTVPFRGDERISLTYLVTQRFLSDVATLDVLRQGQPLQLHIQMKRPEPLVPYHLDGKVPSYMVAGGLLFDVLSVPYLQSEYGDDFGSKTPVTLLELLLFGVKNTSDEQVVLLNRVLASEATTGYQSFSDIQNRNTRLLRLNGQPVVSMAQLAQAVFQGPQERLLRFEVEHDEVLILDAALLLNATLEVMDAHAIPHPMSQDLLQVLAADGAPGPVTEGA